MILKRLLPIVALLPFTSALPGAIGADGRAALTVGRVIYLSARLESIRKSPGPKAAAGASYSGVGIQAQHAVAPYVVEPCSPLTIRKVSPDQARVVTNDPSGMKHTLLGDWSTRIHATEQSCRDYLGAHPAVKVEENTKLQYELGGR